MSASYPEYLLEYQDAHRTVSSEGADASGDEEYGR